MTRTILIVQATITVALALYVLGIAGLVIAVPLAYLLIDRAYRTFDSP